MTNKQYVRGRAYEQRIATKLRKEGWHVTRSAASKGLFDLIAIRLYPMPNGHEFWRKINPHHISGEIKFIQAKSGRSKLRMVKDVLKTDIRRWEGLYQVVVEVV